MDTLHGIHVAPLEPFHATVPIPPRLWKPLRAHAQQFQNQFKSAGRWGIRLDVSGPAPTWQRDSHMCNEEGNETHPHISTCGMSSISINSHSYQYIAVCSMDIYWFLLSRHDSSWKHMKYYVWSKWHFCAGLRTLAVDLRLKYQQFCYFFTVGGPGCCELSSDSYTPRVLRGHLTFQEATQGLQLDLISYNACISVTGPQKTGGTVSHSMVALDILISHSSGWKLCGMATHRYFRWW